MLENAGRAGYCPLSYREIARLADVSRGTVDRVLAAARDLGLVETVGRGDHAIYRLRFTRPTLINYRGGGDWHGPNWPDTKITRLLELRRQGQGYTEIASTMGISRSAVAGKIRRLKGSHDV